MRSRARKMPPPPPRAQLCPRWKPAWLPPRMPRKLPWSQQIRRRPMRKRPSSHGRRRKSPRPEPRQRFPISDRSKRESEPSSKNSLRSNRQSPRPRRTAAPRRVARVRRAAAGEGSHAQAIAVVAESLLRKLDDGGQFSGELAALENLGVPPASLAPLRAASESTVASERQLTARFAALIPGILASESAKQASAEEGFLDRLTRNAKGLLRIRRVGDAEAAGVQGFVARIENALADHDLEAALKAWKELPGAATTQSESWGEAAKARLDALNAARSIEAGAVAVLGNPKS